MVRKEPIWKPKKHTVSFNTDGVCTVPDQTVEHGSTAAKPDVPYCYNGKYVNYWETSLGEKFNFNTKITEDTTLYAHWADISAYVGTGLTNGDTYTVYYGDKVFVRESKVRTDTTVWNVTVNGKELLVENFNSDTLSACIIPSKATPAGNTIDVIFKKTSTVNGRTLTTTTQIHLLYVYKQGDIDGNGTVNSTDAAMLLKHISGKEELDSDVLKRSDANYDSNYDMLDVIAILNKTAV